MNAKIDRALPIAMSAAVLGLSAADATAESPDIDDVDIYIADHLTYDDNLFRLPDGNDELLDLRGPGAERADYLHQMTAGIDGRWQLAQQAVLLDVRLDDNNYRRNSDLDHTATKGKAEWQWRVASQWSGQLGADYTRALAAFANTRFLERDIVESTGVYGRASVTIGPRWTLGAGARHVDTEHGAFERRFDNAEIDTLDGTLRYRTHLDNWIGLAYRHSESDNSDAAALGGSDRSYKENSSGLETHYELGARASFDGGIGYLQRDYLRLSDRDGFSGGVWDATLNYELSTKTAFKLSAWRKLRAYLDAESDYFVATGGSIGTQWQPTDKFGLTLDLVREERNFIASSANLVAAEPRRDRASAAELLLAYNPWRALQIGLTLRAEKRTSARTGLGYDDQLATLAVRFTI